MLRAGTLLAIFAAATAANVTGACAQTLTNPDPRPAPHLSAAAKSQPRDRAKTCGAYGAGFVQLPGTDACVKIGGSVTTDATGIGN
ncbi:MAG: porin [Xanthobacteraceae bacterium]